MLRIVIHRVWSLLSAIRPKVSPLFLVVLSLASRMLQMLIARVGTLLSAVCRKVSLFFPVVLRLPSRHTYTHTFYLLSN